MEALIVIVLLFFGGAILRAIIAGGKSAVTGKSFQESYRGIDNFGARLISTHTTTESGTKLNVEKIQIKGLLPIQRDVDLTAYLSVVDVTEEEAHPVISYVESVQEESTTCFLQVQPMGHFESGVGFKDWVQVGAIIPNFIQPPRTGNRKLSAKFFLVNSVTPMSFIAGYCDNLDHAEIFAFESFDFNFNFTEKGFLDSSEDQKKARAVSVKIAMAVAMSDGSLHENEGNAIKEWIKRAIANFSEERQKELKSVYNGALKEAFTQAKSGKLVISKLTDELNGYDETKIKYDAINLCFDVMAADGQADKAELQTIREVAEALELDPDEVSKIRDKKLLGIGFNGGEEISLEEAVGIDPSWDKKQIKSHLTNEFRKWSNRLTSLKAGPDRDFAQNMLDNIGKARKKYE